MTTLVIAEHDNRVLAEGVAQTITAACALGRPVHILVAGLDCDGVAQQAALFSGVEKVLLVQHEALAHSLAETCADVIISLAGEYTHFVSSASRFGKNVMPRIAARLGVAQLSDVTRILSSTLFEHPVYAGNAIETVEILNPKAVLTIRTTEFEPALSGSSAIIDRKDWIAQKFPVQFLRQIASQTEGVDLGTAKTVIGFGRALTTKEHVEKLIIPLARVLNAGIGATRAAVDAGLAPNDWQVGQTGRIIAPDLYIAIGLSGAIQHLAGIKGARTIVAINNDENAAIINNADFSLVGDLFTLVPELIQEIEELRNR